MSRDDFTVNTMDNSDISSLSETLPNDVCYKVIEEHLFSELQGEAVILSLKNGKYYGLNAVGMTIWQILQNLSSFRQIVDAVMLEYEVSLGKCESEVESFLREMISEGLIDVVNQKSA